MDYYLSLPLPLLLSFASNTDCIEPPTNTRMQQFPSGKQPNFTCVCYRLPTTLWCKFPRRGGLPYFTHGLLPNTEIVICIKVSKKKEYLWQQFQKTQGTLMLASNTYIYMHRFHNKGQNECRAKHIVILLLLYC